MPGKSRHDKGKHLSQSKKRREMQRLVVAQQQGVTQVPKSSAPADIPVPQVKAPTPPRKAPPVAQYPHIAGELKKILILAGIIFIILIVLALVLS